MNNLFKLLLIAAICFCVGNVFSQDAKGSQKAKTTQASNFLNHKVEKGETIYSISKKYNVKESQLLELNPELSKGLKLGSEIKIPKAEKKSSVTEENTSKDKTKNKESKPLEEKDTKKSTTEKVKELPEFHLVEQGQTLYTISKLYGISIDEINENNPEVLENGLKAGKTISIRNKAKVINENVLQSTLKNDTTKLKENVVSVPKETISNDNNNSMPLKKYELSVTLLLPFYTEKNVYEEETEEGSEEEKPKKNTEEIFGKSYNALEYYSGFKFACDSLSKMGYKINLKVIDCPIDSQEVVNLTKTDKLKNSDIIFGPFHQNLSFVLASYCLKNKIWFVTPYTQQNKILLNNPYAIKASASATTQVEKIAEFISKRKTKPQVFVLHNNLKKEKNLVESFKLKFKELSKDSAKEIIFKIAGTNGLKLKLSATKENLLVVCSNDQAFVTDLINKIHPLKKDYNITLFGMEPWANYENLEVELVQDLNLHLPANSYADLREEKHFPFLLSYRKQYNKDHSKFALNGFDFAFNILSMYGKDKEIFADRLQNNFMNGVSSRFNFVKTSPESGFENSELYILKFFNSELIIEE